MLSQKYKRELAAGGALCEDARWNARLLDRIPRHRFLPRRSQGGQKKRWTEIWGRHCTSCCRVM
eukprot:706656-Pyramimonas_sp.AAC.1